MIKRFKIILTGIITGIGCIGLTACNETSAKATSNETQVTNNYTVIENNNIDIYELYEVYLRQYPDGSFGDFLLSFGIEYNDTEYAVDRGIKSIVSIYGTFTYEYIVGGKPGHWTTATQDSIGAGSGVIYKIDGDEVYIITNYHVIYDDECLNTNGIATNIEIFTYGFENEENKITAEFIGGDKNNDIAVLKASLADFNGEIAEVGIAETELKIGQSVIAIGNPLALGISATSGIISMTSEEIVIDDITLTVIRTDATINSGNSGGGLFNSKGELIGITNAKIVSSGVENMGYAIPIEIAAEVINGIC